MCGPDGDQNVPRSRHAQEEMHRKTTAGRRNPDTLRVRITGIPALRYEGFDLSLYEIGGTYDVERHLAYLLIQRGFAELNIRRSDIRHAKPSRRARTQDP